MKHPSPELIRRQLRLMLVATALLVAPFVGCLLTLTSPPSHNTNLILIFKLSGLFFIPTSLILSAAITRAVYHWWRNHLAVFLIGAANVVLSLGLTWLLFLHR